jgi:PEGA domain.
MRKLLFSIFTISTILLITGCDKLENPLDPDKGKLVITSTPALADVYVNGTNSGKKTGDTLSLATGTYNITLKKTLYSDTTFSVTVIKDRGIL